MPTPARTTTVFFQKRLLAISATEVRFGHFLQWIHTDDPDVSPEGNRLDPVFGLAPLERPNSRTEAKEELGGLDSDQLGGEEMAELVGGYEEDDGENPADSTSQSDFRLPEVACECS